MRIDKGKTKQNFIFNITYEVIRVIIPLIMTPYISRVLGSVGIGRFTLAQTYANYFVMFGVIGLNSYATRELAYTRDNEDEFSEVFWSVLSAKIITMGISVLLYIILFWRVFPNNLSNKIYVIYLVSEIFNIGFYFTAVERFKTIAIRNTFVKLLTIALVFLLVKRSNQVWLYTLIIVISDLIGQIINWLSVDRFIFKKMHFSTRHFKRQLRVAVALFIPTLAIQVYTMLDKLMLGILVGESATGVYENANKMIRLASTVASAIIAVFVPKMSNDFVNNRKEQFNKNIEKVFDFVNFLCFPMCFGLIAIIKDFAPWFYGNDFIGIEKIFYIGSPMIISLGWSGIFGTMILVPSGKEKYYTYAVSISAILNFIMNYFMIPRMGAVGAISASLVAEVLGMTIMYYYIRHFFAIKGLIKRCLRYVIASIIMAGIIVLESVHTNGNIMTTFIEVSTGILIYFLILIIVRDNITKEIITFAKSIIKIVLKKEEVK